MKIVKGTKKENPKPSTCVMKSILAAALLLCTVTAYAKPESNIIVRAEGKAKTIFLNDTQFIEVTPKGEHFYCEEDGKGKSFCTTEAKLKQQSPKEAEGAKYDYCVHSQLTDWNEHFKTYFGAVDIAQKKCEYLLPPVVKCGGDMDCCEKNPVRCNAESELMDSREALLYIEEGQEPEGAETDDNEFLV